MQASSCCRRSNSSFRQRSLLRLGDQSLGREVVVLVAKPLLLSHRHEIILDGPPRQLILDVGFTPAQQQRLQALAQIGKVLIVDRPAAFVQLVEVAVEAEQRAEDFRIEVLDDGIELIDAVFERRTRQDESVGGSQGLDPARRLGLPVLDALRFIEHDHVGLEDVVDVFGIAQHLLVVDDGEERRVLIGGEPLYPRAEHQARGAVAEPRDLLFPFGFQRCRTHDQDAFDLPDLRQQHTGSDALYGLAQPHLVGQKGALAEGEMKDAFALIWQ